MEKSWGYHLILDCTGCTSDLIKSRENIYDFTKRLVKDIDMVAYGEPMIIHFGTGNKAGYTLVQLIETSNIAAHFVEETNDVYLDVFSCKTFDPAAVVKLVKEHFNATVTNQIFMQRDAAGAPTKEA